MYLAYDNKVGNGVFFPIDSKSTKSKHYQLTLMCTKGCKYIGHISDHRKYLYGTKD